MTCIDRGLFSQSASSFKRVNYGPEIVDSCMELRLYESDMVTNDGNFSNCECAILWSCWKKQFDMNINNRQECHLCTKFETGCRTCIRCISRRMTLFDVRCARRIACTSAHFDMRNRVLNSILRSLSRRAMRTSNITMLII